MDANSGELLWAVGPVDGTGNADRVADELSRTWPVRSTRWSPGTNDVR